MRDVDVSQNDYPMSDSEEEEDEEEEDMELELEPAAPAPAAPARPRCSICFDDIEEFAVLKPCNHGSCCYQCGLQIAHDPPGNGAAQCPICRAEVTSVERIFFNFF